MKNNTPLTNRNKAMTYQIAFFLAAFLLIVIGLLFQSGYTPAKWMTYRNFDVPGQKNFINYLSPGIKDSSSMLKYDFTRKNTTLLAIVLGGFFPLMLVLRIIFDPDIRLGIFRIITQWVTFVVARLGIFRVTGVCPVKRTGLGVFPFMNCQSCELATGACPLGTFQMSLLNRQIPLMLAGEIILTGIVGGRTVCGWLCPYGFLSDIFDKLPGKRIRHNLKFTWIKYVFLTVFILTSISYFFRDKSDILLYCSYLCPAGFFYGILEYAFTTGVHSLNKGLPFIHIMLVYHFLLGALIIIGSIKFGGRFFCKFACPLGTTLGLFSRISMLKIEPNVNRCTGCKKCVEVCPMKISVLDQRFVSKSNCIMCGRCKKSCPTGKIEYTFSFFKKTSDDVKNVASHKDNGSAMKGNPSVRRNKVNNGGHGVPGYKSPKQHCLINNDLFNKKKSSR
jgi:ferredoxin-type protein NapH